MSLGSQPAAKVNPRIGLNALIKYLDAKPGERERILRDQKYPPPIKVTWYIPSCETITKFIAGGMVDETILTDEVNRQLSSNPSTDHEETKIKLNVEALEVFLNTYEQLQLGELAPTAAPNITPKLLVSGVQISVRPEIKLEGMYRGAEHAGSIKLYFSKLDRPSEDTAVSGAVLIYQHCLEHMAGDRAVRPSSCVIVDIFAGRAFAAPKSMVMRFKNIQAACREIARQWESI